MMKQHLVSTNKGYHAHPYYLQFALRFAAEDISDLVSSFNRQVNNNGWGSIRAYHDRALIDEFVNRGIDISCITGGQSIDFKHPVRYDMSENKLVAIA